MKINLISLLTGLTMVTFSVSIVVQFQLVNAQRGGDLITQSSQDSTFPTTDKILISIVPGAALLTDTAYNPNPLRVNVGQTVLWINDDFSFHTVTSGNVGDTNAGLIFDSGLTGPTTLSSTGKTYQYTFELVGEYPYYCILHPGMMGKVIVV